MIQSTRGTWHEAGIRNTAPVRASVICSLFIIPHDAQLARLRIGACSSLAMVDRGRCTVCFRSETLVGRAAFLADSGSYGDRVAGDYCLWAFRYDPCPV